MSAADHLGPQYAHMRGRMKAKDLVNLPSYEFNFTPFSQVKGGLEGFVEASKEPESVAEWDLQDPYDNLYDHIKANGVRQAVHVQPMDGGMYQLMDGHHRVASAYDIDPEMQVPVYFGATKVV